MKKQVKEFKIEANKPNELYTLLGVVKGKNYSCPGCGTIHNDSDGGYEVNNKQYPKANNKSEGYTLDGNYLDWDELHCCEDCETEYWFRNGAY